MSAAAVPDTRIDSYRCIHIYGTKSRLYVVGHDSGVCRILKFRRQDGPRLDAVVDPICYTPSQLSLVLRKVHEQSGGQLQLICKVKNSVFSCVTCMLLLCSIATSCELVCCVNLHAGGELLSAVVLGTMVQAAVVV